MARLEELTQGTTVKGILPDQNVTVVDAKWYDTSVVELTYKDASGKPGNQILYRDDENRIEVVTAHRTMDAAEYQHVVIGVLFLNFISDAFQDSNRTTWRLAEVNRAFRGIDGQTAHSENLDNERHSNLKPDSVNANPQFPCGAHP